MLKTATWWLLPSWLKAALKPKNPTSITFTAHKTSGFWHFHKPLALTFWEGLAMTPQLDELAKGAHKVKLTCSLKKPKGESLKLTYHQDDPFNPEASEYFDPNLETVWLYPWNHMNCTGLGPTIA